MSAKYITWETAVALSGKSIVDLNDNIKNAIVDYVETIGIELFLGRDFTSHDITIINPELHSPNSNQQSIILKNYPVISITRLRDNIHVSLESSISTLVEHVNFEVIKDTGIIKLIYDSDEEIIEPILFFTSGTNTVDVAYTYGFETPPDDIKAFANLLASKIIKLWEYMDGTTNLKSYKMANYEQRVIDIVKSVDSGIDYLIKNAKVKLLSKYGVL